MATQRRQIRVRFVGLAGAMAAQMKQRTGAQVRWFTDLAGAQGTRRALGTVARRLVGRDYVVLVRDLHTPLPPIPPANSLRWAPLTDADLPQLQALDPAMTATEVRRRQREGQSCRLCWLDESVAHYRWDIDRPAYLPTLRRVFQPQSGDSFGVDVLTGRAFRGRGIDSVGVIAAMHRAKEQGHARSIALVAPWNVPSLRVSLQKAGRTIAGRVGYWGVGPIRRYYASGTVRLVGRRFYVERPGNLPSQTVPSH